MNIGEKVRITECHKAPELVGAVGTVKHFIPDATYPNFIEIPGHDYETDVGKSNLWGFRDNELELVSEV